MRTQTSTASAKSLVFFWAVTVFLFMFVSAFSRYTMPNQTRAFVETPKVFKEKISPCCPKQPPIVRLENKPPPLLGPNKEIFFRSVIHQAADRYQIDPALVKAIIMAESGYNPTAISKKGAKGLMQLMPKTAEALGVKDSFNPKHNIDAGVEYFRKLLDQFDGDVELALAAYNAGSRKVRQYNGIPPFKATQFYIKKVFKYYSYYKEQMTDKIDTT